jgi:hypothetical protein
MVSQGKKNTMSRKSSLPRASTELASRFITTQNRPSQATLNLGNVLEQVGLVP